MLSVGRRKEGGVRRGQSRQFNSIQFNVNVNASLTHSLTHSLDRDQSALHVPSASVPGGAPPRRRDRVFFLPSLELARLAGTACLFASQQPAPPSLFRSSVHQPETEGRLVGDWPLGDKRRRPRASQNSSSRSCFSRLVYEQVGRDGLIRFVSPSEAE